MDLDAAVKEKDRLPAFVLVRRGLWLTGIRHMGVMRILPAVPICRLNSS